MIEGFKETITSARHSSAVALHDYLVASSASVCFHVFFEGPTDNAFYCTFIRNRLQGAAALRTHICGGKEQVYEALRLISTRLRMGHIVAFFVDKDLDDLIPLDCPRSELLFVTRHYSIENYAVTGSMLERLLDEMFGVNAGSQESERVLALFATALDSFHEFMRPLMAYVLLQRRRGISPSLENVSIRHAFALSSELVFSPRLKSAQLIAGLDELNPNNESEDGLEVRSIEEFLETKDPKDYIRGHFELAFFVAFMHSWLDASTEKIMSSRGLKINENTAMRIMGPRIAEPEELKMFLDARLACIPQRV